MFDSLTVFIARIGKIQAQRDIFRIRSSGHEVDEPGQEQDGMRVHIRCGRFSAVEEVDLLWSLALMYSHEVAENADKWIDPNASSYQHQPINPAGVEVRRRPDKAASNSHHEF